MNVIHMLSSQPWVARLGETLVHFLWQGILIAGVYAAARRWMARPNTRYALACVVLAGMTAAPLVTWALLLVMLILRASAGWRGRKAAVMALAVLGCSALTWAAHAGLRSTLFP